MSSLTLTLESLKGTTPGFDKSLIAEENDNIAFNLKPFGGVFFSVWRALCTTHSSPYVEVIASFVLFPNDKPMTWRFGVREEEVQRLNTSG